MRLTPKQQPVRQGQTATGHVQRDAHKTLSFYFSFLFSGDSVSCVSKLGESKKQPFWSDASNTTAETVFHHYLKMRRSGRDVLHINSTHN